MQSSEPQASPGASSGFQFPITSAHVTSVWGRLKLIESTFRSAGQQVKEKTGNANRNESDEQLSGLLQSFETNLGLFRSLQKVSATMAQHQRALQESEAEMAIILAEIAMKCPQSKIATVFRSSSEALHACHKESGACLDATDLFATQVSHLNETVGSDMTASIQRYDSHRRNFDSALLVHSKAEAASQSSDRLAITYEHAQDCRQSYEKARETLRSKIALAANHYNIHLAENITKLLKAKAASAKGCAKPLASAAPYDPATMDVSAQIVLAAAK
jgi:hypothetical protein